MKNQLMLASSLQRKYRGRFCFFKIAELVYINNIDIIFFLNMLFQLHTSYILAESDFFLRKSVCFSH